MSQSATVIMHDNGEYLESYDYAPNGQMSIKWTDDINGAMMEMYDFNTEGILYEMVNDGVGSMYRIEFDISNVRNIEMVKEP